MLKRVDEKFALFISERDTHARKLKISKGILFLKDSSTNTPTQKEAVKSTHRISPIHHHSLQVTITSISITTRATSKRQLKQKVIKSYLFDLSLARNLLLNFDNKLPFFINQYINSNSMSFIITVSPSFAPAFLSSLYTPLVLSTLCI